jgi:hypothetical protein
MTEIGRVSDPAGREVVLLARLWKDKIVRDHPELRDEAEEVLATITAPDHVEPDPLASRQRFYRRGAGPSRWLMAVVSFEQEPGRIITALALRKDPKQWKP